MGQTVKVTSVTVEYAFEGKAFTVQFPDPSKIATIVFSRTDLERVMDKNAVPHVFSPAEPFPEFVDGLKVSASSTFTGTSSEPDGTIDRSLWWHTTACSWFHPEEK